MKVPAERVLCADGSLSNLQKATLFYPHMTEERGSKTTWEEDGGKGEKFLDDSSYMDPDFTHKGSILMTKEEREEQHGEG